MVWSAFSLAQRALKMFDVSRPLNNSKFNIYLAQKILQSGDIVLFKTETGRRDVSCFSASLQNYRTQLPWLKRTHL
jgi:hypothetical protein